MSSKKFNLEFIEERRRDLQDFLTVISEHGELCRAPSMTPFMVCPLGQDFDEGKKKVEQNVDTDNLTQWSEEDTKSETSSGNFTSINKSQPSPVTTRKGITNFFAKIRLSASTQELMTTKDESLVRALQDYITEVQGHTKILIKASDDLVKSTLNTADMHHEIGVPIGQWRTTYTLQNSKQGEDVEGMMAVICKFSDDLSSLLRTKYEEEEFLFCHKIHRLANTVSAFEISLKQRKLIQTDYTHTNNCIIEKNAALEKAQKNYKPPEVTEKLHSERAELESRLTFEKNRFDEITQRILRDAEKYKPQLLHMLKDAFLQYAKVQMSFTTRINEACQRLMPNLGDKEKPQHPSINGDSNSESTNEIARGMAPVAAPAASPPPPPVSEGESQSSEEL